VSLLKRAVGANIQGSSELPVQTDAVQVPVQVLQRCVQTQGDRPVSQVLVKWSLWPTALATWEDEDLLRSRFPFAPAWGQAVSEEEGDVTVIDHQDQAAEHQAQEKPKMKRIRKPNTKIVGPEWRN